MIEGAEDHRKMRLLARLLAIPLPYANGIMERLWLKTAKYHPDGAVGRASDLEIADYCGMPLETDAHAFVRALIEAGWLDPKTDNEGRLWVHDWPEHCTNFVHRRIARHLRFFADGSAPRYSGVGSKWYARCAAFYGALDVERVQNVGDSPDTTTQGTLPLTIGDSPEKTRGTSADTVSAPPGTSAGTESIGLGTAIFSTPVPTPIPVPVPVPVPKPIVCVLGPAEIAANFEDWLAGFRGRKADPSGARRIWESRVLTPESLKGAFAVRDRYNLSDEVQRGILMEAKRFLREQADCNWTGAWSPPKPPLNGSHADSPTAQAVRHAKRKSGAEDMKELTRERIAKGRSPL